MLTLAGARNVFADVQRESVPAVRNRRVHALVGAHLVVAGPRLGIAAEAIARAIHPDGWAGTAGPAH